MAECKFWTGEKDFYAAIHQFLDRYLTWRDSKAEFGTLRGEGFTSEVQKLRDAAAKHPYFVRTLGRAC